MKLAKLNSRETILMVPVYSDLANLGFALRREVFIVEHGVPAEEEFDTKDLGATHFVLIEDGDVVATLRITWHEDSAQISRFVVRKSFRSKGIGSRIFQAGINAINEAGEAKIFLEAQVDKIAFYEKFGFQAYGDEFLDGGIPHNKMRNFDLRHVRCHAQ
jgi:predicted GNAT family N-acyltransferase